LLLIFDAAFISFDGFHTAKQISRCETRRRTRTIWQKRVKNPDIPGVLHSARRRDLVGDVRDVVGGDVRELVRAEVSTALGDSRPIAFFGSRGELGEVLLPS
jgi:hypothetical protein